MGIKIFRRVDGGIIAFLRDTYGIPDPRSILEGYRYIVSGRASWLYIGPSIDIRSFGGYINRVGFKFYELDRDGNIVLSNTFIQLYGGYMGRNVIEAYSDSSLKELLRRTYLPSIEGFKLIDPTPYPYKALKYRGTPLGLVKITGERVISLLPHGFQLIDYLK